MKITYLFGTVVVASMSICVGLGLAETIGHANNVENVSD